MTSTELIEKVKIMDIDTLDSINWVYYIKHPWRFYQDRKNQNFKYIYWIQINSDRKFRLDTKEDQNNAREWLLDNSVTDEAYSVIRRAEAF